MLIDQLYVTRLLELQSEKKEETRPNIQYMRILNYILIMSEDSIRKQIINPCDLFRLVSQS